LAPLPAPGCLRVASGTAPAVFHKGELVRRPASKVTPKLAASMPSASTVSLRSRGHVLHCI
jgi:hypothetical protein